MNTKRALRKLQQSGVISTAKSAWKEIYLINILQSKSVKKIINNYYNISVTNREEHKIASTDGAEHNKKLPPRIWVDSEHSFEDISTESVPEPELFSYKNCQLFVPPGVGFTEDKKIIFDTFASKIVWDRGRGDTWIPSLFYYHGILHTHRFLNRLGKYNTISKDDNSTKIDVGLSLIPYWTNYYHWTLECLPKLMWLEHEYCQERSPKILIPADTPSWMDEYLSLLSVENTYRCDNNSYIVDELIVPRSPEPSMSDCLWIRNKMLPKIDQDINPHKRIFVSRKKANQRRISNKSEIIELLNEYGFKEYILEEISVRKQIELFSQAEIIVGPHGAGLTNIIYAPDPIIIELFGSEKKTSYYRIAKLLNFDYESVSGESKGVDIAIPPAVLQKTLQKKLTQL